MSDKPNRFWITCPKELTANKTRLVGATYSGEPLAFQMGGITVEITAT